MTTMSLAISALGIEPEGSPAEANGLCAACGADFAIAELIKPLAVSSGFMNGRILCHRRGTKPALCGACAPFFAKKMLLKIQKAIVTHEAVYPIGRGEGRAWFILHPPAPPFSVVFSNTKLQHLLWRAPVTLDPDYWKIQLGPRTLTMRRQVVLRAAAVCRRIADAYFAARKKSITTPFLSLDPKLLDLKTGQLRHDLRRFAIEAGLADEIEFLQKLGPGELWGLSPVVFRGALAARPEPLTLSETSDEIHEQEE